LGRVTVVIVYIVFNIIKEVEIGVLPVDVYLENSGKDGKALFAENIKTFLMSID